jgi:hypothetical protein
MRDTEFQAWSGRLDAILADCDLPTPDTARLLRDTYALLRSTPSLISGSHDPDISPANLQSLLDAEAFESAALRLAAKCGWMMSSLDNHVIATVVSPHSEREYSFNARTVALALCGALAASLKGRVTERR